MTATLEPPTTVTRLYLLVQADPGSIGEARSFLQSVPGVVEVFATSGPFDLIVVAEVGGSASLGRLVGTCRRTPGLVRISRCSTVASQARHVIDTMGQ